MTQRRPTYRASEIYRIPLVMALVSAVGLASALLGDGVWDVLSWLTLALPILLAAIYWQKSRLRHRLPSA